MKKEISFLSAMIVFGILLGISIILIIASIAAPDIGKALLTLQEKSDFELMSQRLGFIASNLHLVKYVLLFMAIIAFVLLFVNLNPHVKNKLRVKFPGGKFMVVFFGLIAGFILLSFVISGLDFFNIDPQTGLPWLGFLIFAGIAGFLWFVAGEMGWAGDFLSWKMGVTGRTPRPFVSFALGAIIGVCVYGLLMLYIWSFFKYFILVSEVLDKSGEVSYLGFRLLAYELMFTTGTSFGIIAGLTIALAPVYKTGKERVRWLVFPLLLSAILGGVVLGMYKHAAIHYDLDKKDLAEASGVPDMTVDRQTLVLLKAEKAILQEWPLQAKGSGFVSTSIIAATPENLRKIEEYLSAHKQGSVFTYVAQDMLIRGYHVMWDLEKGIEYQLRYANQSLLTRHLLLSRLRYLPVTQKYLSYLKELSDESKWHVGSDVCLRVAEAYMHFGLIKEAQEWVNKGKGRGADMSKTGFLKDEVITNGRIRGKIYINGKTSVSGKIAIMRQDYPIEKIEDFMIIHKLVDIQNLAEDGSFVFNNLGKGEYLLLVVAGKNLIPFDISQGKINVKNLPGAVKIESNAHVRDVGTVNVMTQ